MPIWVNEIQKVREKNRVKQEKKKRRQEEEELKKNMGTKG